MFSSPVYALDDTEESVVINKIRTPQPWVRFSTDYVRCFCNLPQCVTTGYMCKSSGKGCFSNFVDRSGLHPKDYRGRHGCLELLTDKHLKDSCAKDPKGLAPRVSQERSLQKSRTFCCYHDMCNHIDSPQTRHLINNTLLGDPLGDTYLQNTDNKVDDVGEQVPMDYANSQVWFRAATIAVPICGAVIVFALIALAVKILRGENQNAANRKLGSSVYQRHVTCRKQHCDKLNYYDNNISKKSNNHQRPYKFHQAQKTNNEPLVIEVKKEDIETHADVLKGENNVKLKLLMENERRAAADDGGRSGKCYIFNIESDPQCTGSVNLEHVNNVKYFEDLPVLDNICDVNLSNVHSVDK